MQSDEQAKGLPRMFEGDYLMANLVMFGLLLLVVFIGKLSNQYIEKPSRQYLRKRIEGSNSNVD